MILFLSLVLALLRQLASESFASMFKFFLMFTILILVTLVLVSIPRP